MNGYDAREKHCEGKEFPSRRLPQASHGDDPNPLVELDQAGRGNNR
jgi:hypothetical protein